MSRTRGAMAEEAVVADIPSASLPLYDLGAAAEDLIAFSEKGARRFPTGYTVDELGCIGPGELGLIWARSSGGKSTWVLNVISHTPDVPTVFFNMEMPPRKLIEWLCCMTFDLATSVKRVDEVLRYGPSGPRDQRYAELRDALAKMKAEYPHLTLVRPQEPSLEDLAMALDDIEDKTGVRPQRVFIDHLTLMADTNGYDGVKQMAGRLHSWAMDEGIAVYAIQQTGRGGGQDGKDDGHKPVTLGSGVYAGEHDADFIYGIFRPDKNPSFYKEAYEFRSDKTFLKLQEQYQKVKGTTRLQVIKNRPFGETNERGIVLRFDAHSYRLVEEGNE